MTKAVNRAVNKASVWYQAGIVARIARQHIGRSRTFNAVSGAVRSVVKSTGLVVHLLWLEVTGTLFLAMAGFFAIAGVREYLKYVAGRAAPGRIVVAACFALTFAWFGLSSFWKVRRKSQRS